MMDNLIMYQGGFTLFDMMACCVYILITKFYHDNMCKLVDLILVSTSQISGFLIRLVLKLCIVLGLTAWYIQNLHMSGKDIIMWQKCIISK